ncbi:MAG TPA: hypothetical protein PLT11_08720, partial [Elusimicrobiota bacterium]|nr:hypothetical protein [Elusimicrobiota bacterium]
STLTVESTRKPNGTVQTELSWKTAAGDVETETVNFDAEGKVVGDPALIKKIAAALHVAAPASMGTGLGSEDWLDLLMAMGTSVESATQLKGGSVLHTMAHRLADGTFAVSSALKTAQGNTVEHLFQYASDGTVLGDKTPGANNARLNTTRAKGIAGWAAGQLYLTTLTGRGQWGGAVTSETSGDREFVRLGDGSLQETVRSTSLTGNVHVAVIVTTPAGERTEFAFDFSKDGGLLDQSAKSPQSFVLKADAPEAQTGVVGVAANGHNAAATPSATTSPATPAASVAAAPAVEWHAVSTTGMTRQSYVIIGGQALVSRTVTQSTTPMGATLSVTVSEVNNKYDSAGRLISASGQAHTSSETAIQYDGLQILSANTAKENEILYSLSPLKAIVEYWAYLNRPGGTTVDWSKVTAEQRSYMENLVSTISGLLTSAVPLQSAMAGLVQKTQTTGRGASGASTSQTGSTNLDLTDFLPIFSTLNNLNEKLLAEVEAVLASVSGPQPSGISGALSSILQGINRMLDLKTKLAGTIAGGGLKGVPKQYTESTTQNTYAIVAGQAVLMNASTNSDTFTGFGAHDPHPVTTTHTTSRTDYSYNDVGLLIGAMALSDSRTTNTVLSDGSPQVVVSTARTRSVYTVINGQAQVRESTTNSHSDGSGGASITDSQSTTYYRYDREGHLIGAFGQGEGTTQQLVGNHGGTATQITTSKTTQHYGVFWGQAMVTETITEANTVSNGG